MSRLSIVPAPLKRLPWGILLLLLAIGGFGTVILYSAAGGSFTPWAFSHGIRFVFFFVVALVISRFPIEWFRQLTFPVYIVILLMILLTELIGKVAGGAQSWLDLGPIRLQPSEMMKLAAVMAIARFYEMLPAGEIRRFTAITSNSG